jgi:hypothetical protein
LRYNGVGAALAGIEYLAEEVLNVLSVACISDKMHTGPISKGRSALDSAVEIKLSALSLACAISQHGGTDPLWQLPCSGVFDASALNCWIGSHKRMSDLCSMEG